MVVIGYRKSTARKTHICYWCGEAINPGDAYQRWAWVDGSDFTPIKVHSECSEAWGEAASDEGGFYECGPAEHCRGCTCEA